MFPFQKVICPTDFSEASLCGLKMASEMAEKFGSEVIVLYVLTAIQHLPSPHVEASEITFDTVAYEKRLVKEAQAKLVDIAASIFPESVEPRLEVRIGQPAQEILEASREDDADAIFMATHGRTGLKHIVFGSVAERVVSRADCPVLTVRSCE
jgi:universal stress protein A